MNIIRLIFNVIIHLSSKYLFPIQTGISRDKRTSNLDSLIGRLSLFSANFATQRVKKRKISDLILKISLKKEINDSFNVKHIYYGGSMTGNRGLPPPSYLNLSTIICRLSTIQKILQIALQLI